MIKKIRRVKSLIKQEIKHNIYYKLKYFKNIDTNNDEYERIKNKKKVIIMQTPTHNNLGDHAIAYAEIEFKKEYFKDYLHIEIPFEDVVKESRAIKNILNKNDFIFIIGGGNMGDMYSYEEYVRRYIIKYFNGFNIISFPQTISFSDDILGRWQLNKSKKVYSKNKNLLIIAREQKSFNIMKEIYKENKVILTPDIVLSLDKRGNQERRGIVTCLRQDIEGVIRCEDRNKLIDRLKERYGCVKVTDTVINKNVGIHDRDIELNKIWNLFRNSEVVITDRLHGMIFCAITATPCIVFQNSNHKIEQSYNNWLYKLNYIKFCSIKDIDRKDTIENLIDELRDSNKKHKEFNDCREKFRPLIEYIKEKR